VGRAFGRDRPATGFSMDLREVARLATASLPAGAIQAPYAGTDCALASRISALREQGEIVVELLPGELACEGPRCDRCLVECQGQWIIQKSNGN
jgi:ATP phosphoribosyltransferase regulatory subunit